MTRQKFIWLAGLTLLFCAGAIQAQSKKLKATPDPKIEQELRDLEKARLEAQAKNDKAALERILADNFLITYADGVVLDKKQLLAQIPPDAPTDPALSYQTEDTAVRIYGHTALLTGTFVHQQTLGNQVVTRRFRYTDTYLKRKGRWRLVAAQLSPLLIK